MIWVVIGAGVLLSVMLWVYFLAVMAIQRHYDTGRMPPEVKWPAVLLVVIPGLVIDFAINMTVASVVFLDPAREKTVTDRLQRYIRGDDGWRRRAAKWFCKRYLNPFDPDGNHCD